MNSLARWSAAFALVSGLAAAFSPSPQVKGLSVTFYLSTDCPVAMRQSPRLAALADQFQSKGVAFRGLFPNDLETNTGIQRWAAERKIGFPVELDLGAAAAKRDKVTVVPLAVLRHAKGAVLYQGPLDDAKVDADVKNRYLADALTDALAGRKPALASREPFGCYLMPGPAMPTAKEVTFAEHVAPILYQRCVECHRPGGTGPFSLVGYESARKWSPMIESVTRKRTMPPWPAVQGVGQFHDENRLTEREIAILATWDEAGSPRGDARKEPPAPKFSTGWRLGEPDLTLTTQEQFRLAASGKDEYWNFVFKPDLKEPVWVTAMDVQPGNKKVVHHVIGFLGSAAAADRMLQRPGARGNAYLGSGGGIGFLPGGVVGGWAPGVTPRRLPEGTGILVKPGDAIILQVHYHKTGKEETDQTQVGLYFRRQAPENLVNIAFMMNPLTLRIPAGAASHRIVNEFPVPSAIKLYSLMPHMHLLGRKMKATWVKPDGSEEPLIQIDQWDFNWQLIYMLKEPKVISAGSRLRLEAEFDNSAANPNNPNSPPKLVTFGEETTDEMMLLVAWYSRA